MFILVGMIVGSTGLGLIYFDNVCTAQIIGVFALVIILFEGGLHTKWTTVRSVAGASLTHHVITPYGETKIKEGDFLYILVETKYKEELKKVLKKKSVKEKSS
ncbi:hypothetical protein GCM10010954_10940 [Halobacillus andaensis]|uniref:Cation/H+ exchanger transmembrane domain-containing protein n=1 Tax=Halobacillus andaensis TaxID=1176239 RepID=A0A917B176_HALAA|nr:hypothetical protein GCM10010954_10940 [Halobacillus andaensis]